MNRKEYQKQYDKDNKAKRKEYFSKYYQENKDKIKVSRKEYFQENKEKFNESARKRRKLKPYCYILRNQLKRVKELLGTKKIYSLIKELNYSPSQFKEHIEKQFINKMNWNNIHIDHKIPISWFKENTPFYIVNNLNNLHPIWPEDNSIKNNKFSHPIDKDFLNTIKEHIQLEYINLIEIN